MAKGFSEREKDAIRERLMDAAEACWGRYGLRKTSVDQLVEMAHISKGAFYLFYPSKEHLFMDVFDRIEIRVKDEVFRMIQSAQGSKKDIFVSVLNQMYHSVKKAPWILNISNGDFELLVRKLPPERIAQHHHGDDDASVHFLKLLDMDSAGNIEVLSGVLRSLFLLLLHKQEIGEAQFDRVVEYLTEAIALKLFGEGTAKND